MAYIESTKAAAWMSYTFVSPDDEDYWATRAEEGRASGRATAEEVEALNARFDKIPHSSF
jgi:hypothetical protein